jgi:hypothetical protein
VQDEILMKFQFLFLLYVYCSFGCLVQWPYEIPLVLLIVLASYINCFDILHVQIWFQPTDRSVPSGNLM